MIRSTFTTEQVRQLRQIEHAHVKTRGRGLHAEIQDLVIRASQQSRIVEGHFDSWGHYVQTVDYNRIRVSQALDLWHEGWGRELGFGTFDEYLQTIPEVPAELLGEGGRYAYLTLVDARLSLSKACGLLHVVLDKCDDDSFVPFDPSVSSGAAAYWIRAYAPRCGDTRSVQERRASFEADETGLSVHEGLALVSGLGWGRFREYGMYLLGSVLRAARAVTPYLLCFNTQAICWNQPTNGWVPDYGFASRQK